MNVVTIIQARMGSTRLPGKVLMDIGGQTMLARVVRRASRATLVNQTVVAPPWGDQAIINECKRLGVRVFPENEHDVLDRYCKTAHWFNATTIVRVTGDCPFIDPDLIDATIEKFLTEGADYATNTQPRTYPKGLDVEVMSWDALFDVRCAAKEPYQREHVTPFFYQNPEQFIIANVANDIDHSDKRWTVDTLEDLEFARRAYALMENVDMFSWSDLLQKLEGEKC